MTKQEESVLRLKLNVQEGETDRLREVNARLRESHACMKVRAEIAEDRINQMLPILRRIRDIHTHGLGDKAQALEACHKDALELIAIIHGEGKR